MSLLNLPLVLFRDIIELVVFEHYEPKGVPFRELFDLRLVNSGLFSLTGEWRG
jgi:hypothetical protein